jgi:hypothetical protein
MYNGPYLLASGFIPLLTQVSSLGDPGAPVKTLTFDSRVLREQYWKNLDEERGTNGTKTMDEQSRPLNVWSCQLGIT